MRLEREESEIDVGSQDLSELGGSRGASGVWGYSNVILAQGPEIGDMPEISSR